MIENPNGLFASQLKNELDAAPSRSPVVIKDTDITVVRAEWQGTPEPKLMLTLSGAVPPPPGAAELDPENPLLAPSKHTLPALLRALCLGRPAKEQAALTALADELQEGAA